MNQTDTRQQLETRRAGILHKLISIGPFRRGTLRQVYQKCGKPNCRCMQQPGHPGHGPAWVLYRNVKGRIVNRGIPKQALAQTRAQMQDYQHFQQLVGELIEINEALCHTQLKAGKTAKKGAMQKVARPRIEKSQPDSQPKSAVKSKRSSHRAQPAK